MPPDERLVARYSLERDVLFASVEPVRRTLSKPAAADFFWLRDRETAEIVGFECLHFSRNVWNGDWLNSLPTDPTFTLDGTKLRRPLAVVLPDMWREVADHRSVALALG